MSDRSRLVTGVCLLIAGSFMPFCIYPVMQSSLSDETKTALSGILFFGFEIMALPAVAIMGKENYLRIMKKVKGWFGKLKPSGKAGRVRYNIGLALFILPILPNYIMAYFPSWLPDLSPQRLWVNIGADMMFLISLFVLGGDFWDKLRSLFIWEARAVFGEKK